MSIRPLTEHDFEIIAELIRTTILQVNAKDYSEQVIGFMLKIDPFRPRNMFHERSYFLYDSDWIHGIIWIKDNEIKTFFVGTNSIGKGIWTALLSYANQLISQRWYQTSCVYSSISAKSFYEKNGYTFIREDISEIGTEKLLRYYLEKKLYTKACE